MQKVLWIVALALCATACNEQKAAEPMAATFDEKTETAAIMRTIEAETDCFYRRDYEGWKKNYVQADYAFQGWNHADGTIDAKTGWHDVDNKIGSYIRENPVPKGTTAHPKVEKRNLLVHFFSDKVAYLVWDQYNSDTTNKFYWFSKDQRIMEKISGAWKVANVSTYWDYKNTIPIDSL